MSVFGAEPARKQSLKVEEDEKPMVEPSNEAGPSPKTPKKRGRKDIPGDAVPAKKGGPKLNLASAGSKRRHNAKSQPAAAVGTQKRTTKSQPTASASSKRRHNAKSQPADKMHFVMKHQTELIGKVKPVEPILDDLMEKKLLTREQYDLILGKKTSQAQMRELYSYVRAWGYGDRDTFLSILEVQNEPLIRNLRNQ